MGYSPTMEVGRNCQTNLRQGRISALFQISWTPPLSFPRHVAPSTSRTIGPIRDLSPFDLPPVSVSSSMPVMPTLERRYRTGTGKLSVTNRLMATNKRFGCLPGPGFWNLIFLSAFFMMAFVIRGLYFFSSLPLRPHIMKVPRLACQACES